MLHHHYGRGSFPCRPDESFTFTGHYAIYDALWMGDGIVFGHGASVLSLDSRRWRRISFGQLPVASSVSRLGRRPGTSQFLLMTWHGFVGLFDALEVQDTTVLHRKVGSVPTSAGWSCAWHPDGSLVAVAMNRSPGSSARIPTTIYRVTDEGLHSSLTEVAALPFTGNGDRSLAWSPDGGLLATGSLDGRTTLWDTTTWEAVRTLRGHGSMTTALAWHPRERHLAAVGTDRAVYVWKNLANMGSKNQPADLTLHGHVDRVNHVSWSPCGKLLATASHDRTVGVWDAASGQLLLALHDHRGAVWSTVWSAVQEGKEGLYLLSTSVDCSLRVVHLGSGLQQPLAVELARDSRSSSKLLSVLLDFYEEHGMESALLERQRQLLLAEQPVAGDLAASRAPAK